MPELDLYLNNRRYCYNLGNSDLAYAIVEGFKDYKKNKKHVYLIKILQDCSRLRRSEAYSKSNGLPVCAAAACIVSFASKNLTETDTVLCSYQKFFMCKTIIDMHTDAEKPILIDWLNYCNKIKSEFPNNKDLKKWCSAGLPGVDPITKKAILNTTPDD